MNNESSDRLDVAQVKAILPCDLLQLVQAESAVRLKRDGKSWKGYCPFHDDKTPSFSVYIGRDRDWRFHCPGCGADGDILDWVKRTQGCQSLRQALDWLTGGRGSEFLRTIDLSSHERGGVVTDTTRIQRINPLTPRAWARMLRDRRVRAAKPQYEPVYKYSRQRGWLPDSLVGAEPYPVGAGVLPGDGERAKTLADYPLLTFPHLVRTKRTALLFNLGEAFDQFDSEVCVGVKYRLTPPAQKRMLALAASSGADMEDAISELDRWVARPGFTPAIPWEFDANAAAERLVVLEGPGDGVRLYHESHATADAHDRFGAKSHIVAADSTSAWTEASFPVPAGGVSFFSAYRHIILLLDSDSAGRRAASVFCSLIRKQGADAIVRDVELPFGKDVSSFFDDGNTLVDLISVINETRPINEVRPVASSVRPN